MVSDCHCYLIDILREGIEGHFKTHKVRPNGHLNASLEDDWVSNPLRLRVIIDFQSRKYTDCNRNTSGGLTGRKII